MGLILTVTIILALFPQGIVLLGEVTTDSTFAHPTLAFVDRIHGQVSSLVYC